VGRENALVLPSLELLTKPLFGAEAGEIPLKIQPTFEVWLLNDLMRMKR